VSDEQEQKPSEYLLGLALGTAVAAAAWFLYKTKKGKRLRGWWKQYFSQIQNEWAKLQGQAAEPAVKPAVTRIRRPKSSKKLFLKSGRPLVK
jgi:gas vesicle protein